MSFRVDRASRSRHFAYFERLLRWADLDHRGWHAVFMGRILGDDRQLVERPWRTDYANRRVYYSSYHMTYDTIPIYASHLTSKAYEWIEGYPSAIANLGALARERGIRLPEPSAVIPSSETLDPETRREIERTFGDRIWEFYTAAEQAAFISQCSGGSLHVNPDYGMVEFIPMGVDTGGEQLHEIVATSFNNHAMPLIRYRTGDLVTLPTGSCSCGLAFPRVGRIVGRTAAAIRLSDGRRVTGISNVPKNLPIRKSQLVEIDRDVLEIHIVPEEGQWTEALEEVLLDRLRERLGARATVSVRVVDEIPGGPGGKFQLVKTVRPLDRSKVDS